ncbi:unnamed protein product [Didymodactylos carnosus]|uniref:Uncharacterized protein n=1 Tax=Didymodactylos carnosus TaxID=1234261 RepID=A0A815RWB6_9BILA|nr:unnamed protein product [Didymodactylos carnosus]CAF1483445.1 unnamed protein product [Didymodactylos carnosus]CAF3848043.1 unnamed protein product [Didymodactylos carnosus]CAF4347955.1 unnamed protein product [Didymodactylos carnosus]
MWAQIIAKRFKIKGGHKLIMSWYARWNGTVESLEPKWTDGRPRTITKDQVTDYILNFVDEMSMQYKSVNYRMIQEHVENSLNKQVPLKTIQRYDRQECGINSKRTKELTTCDSKYPNFISSGFAHGLLITFFNLS